MEIRQLRYFLDIAQTQHLTESAKNLFVTQSTLSHGLRQLEEDLGVKLFDRVGRGLLLSQAGAEFRAYAARALQEIEAGKMALTEMSALRSGTLTIGVIPTFLNTLVPATVAKFSALYPKVRVIVRDLRAAPIAELLVNGQLDVGIAFHPAEREDVETEPLFEERMLLVVAATHRLATRKSLAMKSLANEPMALLTKSFATRRLLDDAFREAGVVPSIRVEMESVEALLASCRTGSLVSIVPERAARQAEGLRRIALISPQPVRKAGVLWRKGSLRSPAAKEFVALLKPAVK
jgi:LysR family transcriptional regulator, cyn operon transcriptional activator